MSGEGDGENFLARWSRRKVEARAAEPAVPEVPAAPLPDAQAPAAGGPIGNPAVGNPLADPAAEPPAELPSVDSLQGLAGEYREFLKPEVNDELRRAALKKLFADPHFNVIDVNEAYSGDYTQSIPIPPAVMATLEQAKHLWFDEDAEKKKAQLEREAADAAAAGGEAPPGIPVQPDAASDTIAAQDAQDSSPEVPPADAAAASREKA